jgi:hypothetical protein
MVTYTSDDSYTDWTKEKPNTIQLQGNTAAITGTGAAVEGSTVMIALPGVYVISGKLEDGQIIVDSQGSGTVKLVLNGADITSRSSAAIYVKNADKTVVSLPEGTDNVLTDAAEYVYSDPKADEPNAALFSKDNLTINGTGALTVNANFNNGIMSKDDLRITGGSITVYSVDDGIVGRDMLAVKDGSIVVEAQGDALRSTNDEKADKGYIALSGGTYKLTSGKDGIQAAGSLLISGGQYVLTTGGGSANAAAKAQDSRQPMGGGFGGGGAPAGNAAQAGSGNAAGAGSSAATTAAATTSAAAQTSSAKAIKAASDLTITGGTFTIDSADDAVHSNNTLSIGGGELTITSGDDGLHADFALTVSKGTIFIQKSYEGIESKQITLAGGKIEITASDDGINAGGGNDGSSVNGRPGQNGFSASGDTWLTITGGSIAVNAAGDGLDSNGLIKMSGGTVTVNGPSDNGNGALDYDGTFIMTGGALVAAGSSGMAQAPSEDSSAYSVMMSFSSAQKAGTTVTLTDKSGQVVASFTPAKQFQTIVFASPGLTKDSTYTVYTGGTVSGQAEAGLTSGGALSGGTKVVEFMPSSPVTYLSETGVTTKPSGGMGGGRMDGGVGDQGQMGGQQGQRGQRPNTQGQTGGKGQQ